MQRQNQKRVIKRCKGKKCWDPDLIRERINEVLPEGRVLPRHNKEGHFYQVVTPGPTDFGWGYHQKDPVYPSVTGKLQILKDEGLANYKMNRAIESLRNFIFANKNKFASIDEGEAMGLIDNACSIASRVSQDILEDAGDVGTRIHNLREVIFNKWIETKVRPADFLAFIPPEEQDIRVTSAIRALQKFCEERDYRPIRSEMLVYSHELKVAGTLDDIGLIREIVRQPQDPACTHPHGFVGTETTEQNCLMCGYKYRYKFVLMDLKTSNQFKDHYFFQVCLYWWMLWQLMGREWAAEECFILKVSKEDGTYKIEELKELSKLARYARHMLKTNEGVDFIRSLRKDNQRTVIKL